MGRVLVNDQIVAHLGALVHAPVPHVALIDVPAELIAAQPQMAHMSPGVAHGSRFVEDVSERTTLEHVHVLENRERFARLAVLYGWVGAADHQFVYGKPAPHLVHSVDHGHFFPGGPTWTENTLQAAVNAQLDSSINSACNFTQDERESALQELSSFAEDELTRIVAIPPDEWGLSVGERMALVEFLRRRRNDLLTLLPPPQN